MKGQGHLSLQSLKGITLKKAKKTFWFCDLFIYYYYYYYYYYLEDSAFTVVKRMQRCLLGI